MSTIRIDVVAHHLYYNYKPGIGYHMEGGTVIRGTWSHQRRAWIQEPLHHSVTSIYQAVAKDAHRVLGPGETLAKRYRHLLPD